MLCVSDARAHGDGEESVTAGKTLELAPGTELGNGKLGQCQLQEVLSLSVSVWLLLGMGDALDAASVAALLPLRLPPTTFPPHCL